jgi:hypothetical protein
VVIGENLTYADAARFKVDAIAAGFGDNTWLWNPVDTFRALQRS